MLVKALACLYHAGLYAAAQEHFHEPVLESFGTTVGALCSG